MQSREMRELSAEDLVDRVRDLERSYFQLRLDHAAGGLQDTASLTRTRRDIARAKTILSEKQAQA